MIEFPSGKATSEGLPDSREKSNAQKVRLLVNGEEKTFDAAEFFKEHGVDNWVRIQDNEFDEIDSQREYIDHFNFKETNSVVGKKYLFMRILKGGVKGTDTQKEVPPLLSLNGAFVAECIEVKSGIPYNELTEAHFEYSLKGVTDIESLKKRIFERYKESRTGLTPDTVEQAGVAHTRFRISHGMGKPNSEQVSHS